MNNIEWEIKSPVGKSKHTIQEQFKRASKQAKNIIIDARRTKLKDNLIKKHILVEINKRSNIKKVILINKKRKVIEIYL